MLMKTKYLCENIFSLENNDLTLLLKRFSIRF